MDRILVHEGYKYINYEDEQYNMSLSSLFIIFIPILFSHAFRNRFHAFIEPEVILVAFIISCTGMTTVVG